MKPFDKNGQFLAAVEGIGLRRSAVRGASFMMFAQILTFAVQIVSTVVLSRMLRPQDFGIVAMVTTFSILLVSCGQIGIPEAVVQRKTVDHRLVTDLFWLNSGVAFLLSILFAMCGGLISRFYHDPRLAPITVALSLPIVLTSLSVIHVGLLKRAMRFTAVSLNEVTGRAVMVGVTMLFAFLGWGYWAIVFGFIAQPISLLVGAWIACRWVPGLPRRRPEVKEAVRFAVHVYTRFTTGYMGRNVDNFLVGWAFGPAMLGFYKRAYDLFNLPASQLLYAFPVGVSTLSRLADDTKEFKRYFFAGLSLFALVGFYVGGAMTLVGPDLVRFVLGPGWETSGRIFQLFGPGIAPMLIYSTAGMMQLSLGSTARFVRWGIVELTTTVVFFAVALHWGAFGIAAAWTISYYTMTLPALWYAGRPIKLEMSHVTGVLWPFAASAILGGLVCHASFSALGSIEIGPDAFHALTRAIIQSSFFLVLYAAGVVIFHRGFGPLIQFWKVVRELLPARFRTAQAAVPVPATQEKAVATGAE